MKKIEIKGKRNIDKVFNPNKKHERKIAIDYENKNKIDFKSYNTKSQIQLINKLYMDLFFDEREILEKEIKKKHYGYKQQDIQKNILDNEKLISVPDIYEKLVASKLKCFYCSTHVSILYKNVRENNQWTLDRINNDYGHNYNNVVICCLKCNVKRKTMDSEKFKFTKTLKIVKKNDNILNNGNNNMDKK